MKTKEQEYETLLIQWLSIDDWTDWHEAPASIYLVNKTRRALGLSPLPSTGVRQAKELDHAVDAIAAGVAAADPDLLEALKACVPDLEWLAQDQGLETALNKALAAIAKANQPHGTPKAQHRARVAIEISGGLFDHATTDDPSVDVIIIDYDNLQAGDPFDSTPENCERVTPSEFDVFIQQKQKSYQ